MYDLGLEAFLAVTKTGSISKAAEHLHLAQPTISKRLQILEQQVGTILFERGHKITLTPSGEAFVDLAERWDSLKQQIETFKQDTNKIALSIGTIDTLTYSIFPALYDALSRHTPKIKLQVITSKSLNLYDEIELRKVDVAFSLIERIHPSVVVEECYTEPLVLLKNVSKSNAEAETIHPSALTPENELFVNWGPLYQNWHDKWWDPFCWGRTNLASALLPSALQCSPEKWSIVPLSIAKSIVSDGALSIFYLSDPPPERKVYKLTHKNPKISSLKSLEIFNEELSKILAHTKKA